MGISAKEKRERISVTAAPMSSARTRVRSHRVLEAQQEWANVKANNNRLNKHPVDTPDKFRNMILNWAPLSKCPVHIALRCEPFKKTLVDLARRDGCPP